jgi:hypothetical protein
MDDLERALTPQQLKAHRAELKQLESMDLLSAVHALARINRKYEALAKANRQSLSSASGASSVPNRIKPMDNPERALTPQQIKAYRAELKQVESMELLSAVHAVARINRKYEALAKANRQSSSSASGASSAQ